jgi:AcrR family transcriptional regulator
MPRTQQQRRDETIAKLLDASIETIVELGYARASAAEITKRAGVSVGALFRHFDTMGDFMAATAQEVFRRQIAYAVDRAAEMVADRSAVEALLEILQEVTRNADNAVMYELLIAARTDEKLRDTLQEVLTDYGAKIYDAVRALPGSERVPDESLGVLMLTLINVFDGAALVHSVQPNAELDKQRAVLLASLLNEKYGA